MEAKILIVLVKSVLIVGMISLVIRQNLPAPVTGNLPEAQGPLSKLSSGHTLPAKEWQKGYQKTEIRRAKDFNRI